MSVNLIMEHLPASEQRLVQIRTAQDADDVCKRLKNMVQTGWPRSRKALPPQLQLYWQYQHNLLVVDGLLMKDDRLVISVTMQEEMLHNMRVTKESQKTVVTDNGPQFSAVEFVAFARDYDFTHTTSSPRYPQSDREAERTVKSLLKKGEDPHKALMAYRATPLSHGSSLAQLLGA
ncbi:hypothetical protein D5F01_LYC24775 [Larimichthys crocea]|uniref:Integrase catalytic domain-containing protein n=1 Tax=Larimichthys crocea TaxID=215358 RepID=A0A6G0HE84_LARCR|nr:hypothetical protein D5F01_LYC24775 [Larimichthys crocea]